MDNNFEIDFADHMDEAAAKRKILIVDDSYQAVSELKGVVSRQFPGVEMVCVRTLKEAKAAFEADAFDAVITELNLPDSKGIVTVSSLQRSARGVPVIVLTAIASKVTALEAVKAGAANIMLKARMTDQILGEVLGRHLAVAAHERVHVVRA